MVLTSMNNNNRFCKAFHFNKECNSMNISSKIFDHILMNENFQNKNNLYYDEYDRNTTIRQINDILNSIGGSSLLGVYREIYSKNAPKSALIKNAISAGDHWSLYEESANPSYDNDNRFGNVKFEGIIHPSNIDILKTIVANLQYPEEYEIIPKNYSDIELLSVKVKKCFNSDLNYDDDNEWIETFDNNSEDYKNPLSLKTHATAKGDCFYIKK